VKFLGDYHYFKTQVMHVTRVHINREPCFLLNLMNQKNPSWLVAY